MKPDISVVIVSFNTRDLLRECLATLRPALAGLSAEVFVVDNASLDGSPDMVSREFPDVNLIRSEVNLGFAGANNVALRQANGRFAVLLNSDAFVGEDALRCSVRHMDAQPRAGLGGARLVGRDGAWQPSARLFPSPLNDLLVLSGLSARFPRSRFFGRFDRTWANPAQPAEVDWVPGAFSIIRRTVLDEVGLFDERFFLYYEEVDLCRRIKAAGHSVWYWPDIVVVHLGGESSKTVTSVQFSASGAQLAGWRLRSAFLYYRKHHGDLAWLAKETEQLWHWLRARKNASGGPPMQERAQESEKMLQVIAQAWRETSGGGVSPARPW